MRDPVAGRRERHTVLSSSMQRGEILDQQLFKKSALTVNDRLLVIFYPHIKIPHVYIVFVLICFFFGGAAS
jgi:hypothetical protein